MGSGATDSFSQAVQTPTLEDPQPPGVFQALPLETPTPFALLQPLTFVDQKALAVGSLRTLEHPFPRVGKLYSEDLPPARLQDDVRRRHPPTDAPPSTAILKGLIGLSGIREAVTICGGRTSGWLQRNRLFLVRSAQFFTENPNSAELGIFQNGLRSSCGNSEWKLDTNSH